MAQNMLGAHGVSNFVNSNRATSTMGGDATGLSSVSTYASFSSLDGRLSAFDPFTYTTAVLNQMNYNDKVFALRSIDDRTTISASHPAQVARSS